MNDGVVIVTLQQGIVRLLPKRWGMGALPAKAGGTGLGIVATFNQKFRSPGKFVVMRQVQGQARKLTGMSGSGPVMVTRVRHSLVITGQFCSDEAESRSS